MSDHLQIALEDGMVRDIEPEYRRVKPNVCFRDVVAEKIWGVGLDKMVFQFIQRCKHGGNGGIVGVLRGCEASSVHTIVELRINPCVHFFDGRLQTRWEKSCIAFCRLAHRLGNESVELGVKHANDFAGLVVHDGFCRSNQPPIRVITTFCLSLEAYRSSYPIPSAPYIYPHTQGSPSDIIL
jgi:hypothetical protein